jgi:predicted permease
MSSSGNWMLALRTLGRRPAMTGAILITLALGIGASTAVFTIIDAVLLRPVAATNPNQLVAVSSGTREGANSYAFYQTVVKQSRTLLDASVYWVTPLQVSESDQSVDVSAMLVSENYFALLGIGARIGRPITASDAGGGGVAVLSWSFWRLHFGGDSSVVGKPIVLRGQTLTVVGVMPENFKGTNLSTIPDLWIPLSFAPALQIELLVDGGQLRTALPVFSIVGRLRPGIQRANAEVELRLLAAQSEAALAPPTGPNRVDARVSVASLTESTAGPGDRGSLLLVFRVLAGVVILTLILVCLNIANLLVVRSRERAQELGTRLALGASTGHIVYQLLTESLVLSLAGGIAGVGVAHAAVRGLWAFWLPGGISIGRLQPDLNPRVLAFSFGLSLLTALAFGLLPAVRASRMNVMDSIRGSATASPLGHRHVGLIAIQIAMSLALLVDAGLLVRTIGTAFKTELGFDARGVAALTMAPRFEGRYKDVVHDYEAVVAALESKANVQAAAVATHVPLARFSTRPFGLGSVPEVGTIEQTTMIGSAYVSDRYFDVLGVPILHGRTFGAEDAPGAQRVVILNESAARALWPNESAIGKLVHAPWFGPTQFAYTVVGVVRDTKYAALEDAHVRFAYFRIAQDEPPGARLTFLVRSQQPRAALAMMEQTVGLIAPAFKVARVGSSSLPVRRIATDQVSNLLLPQRFGASLFAGFALLALIVAAVGIYGTIAHTVSRRATEIGIRMALGARPKDVLSIILFDTGVATAIGSALGLLVAGFSSTLLRRFLVGIGPFDFLAFGAALAVMVTMACTAAFLPSWRSISIDPARAIRKSQ